jgi:hypothetical protein
MKNFCKNFCAQRGIAESRIDWDSLEEGREETWLDGIEGVRMVEWKHLLHDVEQSSEMSLQGGEVKVMLDGNGKRHFVLSAGVNGEKFKLVLDFYRELLKWWGERRQLQKELETNEQE